MSCRRTRRSACRAARSILRGTGTATTMTADEVFDEPVMTFADAAAFESWLDVNASSSPGVWLQVAKVGSGVRSLTSDEAVDVGLCFGWISAVRRSLDDLFYLQRYVPRRPRSRWSQVNVAKVGRLELEGRMRPAGIAEVTAAQADGRWSAAYESQRNATIPDDLLAALDADPAAADAFQASSRTEQYAAFVALATARHEATRAARLSRIVERFASGST